MEEKIVIGGSEAILICFRKMRESHRVGKEKREREAEIFQRTYWTW